MKRIFVSSLSILLLFLIMFSCSQGPDPATQRLQALRKQFDQDITSAQAGDVSVDELRKRIAEQYGQALSNEKDARARGRYLLSEAGLVYSLPASVPHNEFHRRNLIDNFNRQGIKLSGSLLPSGRQDKRWEKRDIAGALSVLESGRNDVLSEPFAELALARTYLALGRTSELLSLAREKWSMKDLKGDVLYGSQPPQFEGLAEKPYEELRRRRSEAIDVKLKRFQAWLSKAAKPGNETIRMSFSYEGKPLRGVHVVLFPERDPRYLKEKRPFAARYPGSIFYDWALFGTEPLPDGTDSPASIFPLLWAVSNDDGTVRFSDLAPGKYRVGDLLFDEALFNDSWPNHAPDTSLHDVTFLALNDKASGTLPEIRFTRAPVIELSEMQVLSPENPVIRWNLKQPTGWKNTVTYRVVLHPAYTAQKFAEGLDIWSPRALEIKEPELRLNKLAKNLEEGIYRFKVAAMMNGSVIDETNTGMVVISKHDAARTRDDLQKLQAVLGKAEGLKAFQQESEAGPLSWYAGVDLLSLLADKTPQDAARVRDELLKALPRGHYLAPFLAERYVFLSKQR